MTKVNVMLALVITAITAIIIIPAIADNIDSIEEQNGGGAIVIGKNKLDITTLVAGSLSDADGSFTAGGANLTITGSQLTIETTDVAGFKGAVSDFIEIDGSTDYTLHGVIVSGGSANNPYAPKTFLFYDENQNFISHGITNLNIGGGETSRVVTSPATAKYLRVAFLNASQTTTVVDELQVEQNNGFTTYEPYTETELASATTVTRVMRLLPLIAVTVIVVYFVKESKH